MSTPDGEVHGRAGPDRRRTAVLVTALVLATLAGAAVVLADDARWLRLGIVAALWSALLAAVVLARRGRPEALGGAVDQADEVVDALEAQERLAALHRDHERRLAREVAAREESEQTAERAREEAAALRDELDRLRADADAVTLQGVAAPAGPPPGAPRPRAARLRLVGDSGPLPRGSGGPGAPPPPTRSAVPGPPVPRNGSPVASLGRLPEPPERPPHPAPPPEAPCADPSVLATGSFVDQYVRAAGYVPSPDTPGDPPDGPRPRRGLPGGAANRWPGESSATTGRTVAELLAAHGAASGTGGRRRRSER